MFFNVFFILTSMFFTTMLLTLQRAFEAVARGVTMVCATRRRKWHDPYGY